MKTKLLTSILSLILTAALLTSCTPSQAIAGGNYIAGAQLATYALGKYPDAVPALQHLANVLPDIIIGKVPPYEMGQLNKQLGPIFRSAKGALPSNASTYTRLGSLLSAGSQLNGANPTAYQGIAIAVAIDVQRGINDSIQFNAGRNSIADPPAVASAVARHAATHP